MGGEPMRFQLSRGFIGILVCLQLDCNLAGTNCMATDVTCDAGWTLMARLGQSSLAGNPALIPTLYVLNGQTRTIRAYTVANDGSLALMASYPTGLANAGILLWNGKHIIVGGAGTGLQSYLRAGDGSLQLAGSLTLTFSVSGWDGTVSILPSGQAFYAKSGADEISKIQIDSDGNFSGETRYSYPFWLAPGPVHPSGNYLITMQLSGQHQGIWSITPSTGALTVSANTTQITAPIFHPEDGDCLYSKDGNYTYCADTGSTNGGNIKQMSVTATSLTPLGPFAVTIESAGAQQGPKALALHPSGNVLFAYGTANLFSYPVNTGTGIVGPASINSVPAPNTCAVDNADTNLVFHTASNSLYSICPTTGALGVYPVSGSGSIGSPVIVSTAASTAGQRLVLVQ